MECYGDFEALSFSKLFSDSGLKDLKNSVALNNSVFDSVLHDASISSGAFVLCLFGSFSFESKPPSLVSPSCAALSSLDFIKLSTLKRRLNVEHSLSNLVELVCVFPRLNVN